MKEFCGSHFGGRMLTSKVVRVGYYSLGMNKDSSKMVKHCNKYQWFDKVSAPWPFSQWVLDIMRPLQIGK